MRRKTDDRQYSATCYLKPYPSAAARPASAVLSIMALPSQAATPGFEELIHQQQPCVPKNGVYHRMEESDTRWGYRNKMQLTLHEGSVFWKGKGSSL